MEFLIFMQGCVNRLYHSQLVETPSPVSPSPYQGEGELVERGASPLLYTPLLKGSFRGTKSLLHNHLPLSFEGEGDTGGEVD